MYAVTVTNAETGKEHRFWKERGPINWELATDVGLWTGSDS